MPVSSIEQRAVNQSTIYEWIYSYKELHSGCLVGTELQDTWVAGQRPKPRETHIITKSDFTDEEYEFAWDPRDSQV